MKLFKHGVEKKLKSEKKKRKGRPTCKKDEDEEKKKSQNPKYKFINIQMEKLENMYIILTAEDGMSKFELINVLIQFLNSFLFRFWKIS